MLLFSLQKRISRQIERSFPRYAFKLAGWLPSQWVCQAIGMMNAFGVTRDLGADHAIRISVIACPVDTSNFTVVQ